MALKDGYGLGAIKRNEQDKQAAEFIRQVMEYKGFAKGPRQIYMMLPKQAETYLMSATAEILAELNDGHNWEKHPQLAYIYEMRELF